MPVITSITLTVKTGADLLCAVGTAAPREIVPEELAPTVIFAVVAK